MRRYRSLEEHPDYQRRKNMSRDEKVSESIDVRTKQLVEYHRQQGRDIRPDDARAEAVKIAERVEKKVEQGAYKKK